MGRRKGSGRARAIPKNRRAKANSAPTPRTQRDARAAAAAAGEALTLSRALETIVPAARVLRRTGNATEARQLAAGLEGSLQKQSRAYGKILLAEIALDEKKAGDATDLLMEARKLAD